MTEPIEPTTVEELPRPFLKIGEQGWAERARSLLEDYGVPLPTPMTPAALDEREAELGVAFPSELRTFLTELGPLDLDAFRFLPPSEMKTLEDHHLAPLLPEATRRILPELLAALEYVGEPFAIHLPTGTLHRVSHDPLGLTTEIDCFNTIVRVAFLRLPAGYYGFPGEAVQALVEDGILALTGHRL